MGRGRRLLLDLEPLRRDRDFRLLWLGQSISGVGRQVTAVALPFQVFVLTGSTLAVGAIAGVQLLGILLFALGGGAVADSVDRRRLLLATQIGLALTSLMLAGLALGADPPPWAIYVVAFASAAIGAVDQPARSSALPRLVPRERLPAALALNQVNFQTASVAGPALGGLLLAVVGPAGAYLVDVATYGAAITAVFLMAPLPPIGGVTRASIAAIREGLRFAAGRRVILATFVADLDAMVFGMPTSLFPVLSQQVFRAGPVGFGLMVAAPAAGALVAALSSGWIGSVRRPGRATIVAIAVWGAAIVAFGLSTFSLALALVFLAVAGAADLLSAVFRSTIVQLEAPDELRGRVSALHTLVVTSGPRLGDMEAAVVAAVVGPTASVVSGGVLCLVGVAAVARAFPELVEHVSRALPRGG